MPRPLPTDGELCESCKREATVFCGQRTKQRLLSRTCMVPLCDDCCHWGDKRVPLHDRKTADRTGNKTRAEEQAEELLEIGDTLGMVKQAAAETMQELKPTSARQRRKQRDDLVQLLDELAPQTVVPEGMSDTSRPGEPSS